jgi:YD repeat-containing protein
VTPGNYRITYIYDRAERLKVTIVPPDKRTTCVYDRDGNLDQQFTPPGRNGQSIFLDFDYNAAGWRALRRTIAAGGAVIETVVYDYDKSGKLLSETGSLTSYRYDSAGRLTGEQRVPSVLDWCGLSVDQWSGLTVDEWSALLVCSPAYAVTFQYDGTGNINVEEVDGVITTAVYEFNRVVSRQVNGRFHSYGYDYIGRRIQHEDTEGKVTT